MPAPRLDRQILTVGQVARIIHVSHGLVTRWIDDGILPGYRLPPDNHRRVHRKALVNFMREQNMPFEGLEDNPQFTQKVLTLGFSPEFISRLDKAFERYTDLVVCHSMLLIHAGIELAKRSHQTMVVNTSIGKHEALMLPAILDNYPDHKRIRLFAVTGEDEGQDEGLKYSDAGYTHIIQQPVDPASLANKVWFFAFNGRKDLNHKQ